MRATRFPWLGYGLRRGRLCATGLTLGLLCFGCALPSANSPRAQAPTCPPFRLAGAPAPAKGDRLHAGFAVSPDEGTAGNLGSHGGALAKSGEEMFGAGKDMPLSDAVMDRLLAPIPDLKTWKSKISAERLKHVWQFGNLRMASWYPRDTPPGIPELLKKYHITAVTHSAPVNATYGVDFMPSPAGQDRVHQGLQPYQDADIVTFPYYDFGFCPPRDTSTFAVNWDKFRERWEPYMVPLPADLKDSMAVQYNGRVMPDRLSQDAPTIWMRALMAARLILSSGSDGTYWDNCGYAGGGDFGPSGVTGFRQWLGRNFDARMRKELFGTDNLDDLTPSRALPPGKNWWRLQRDDVTPLTVAFLRYRVWRTGWMREQIGNLGRRVDPNFIMMSTYNSFSTDYYSQTGIDVAETTKGGRRDSAIFWEPEASGPQAGPTLDEAKARAGENVKMVEYGRRSFSPELKYLVGASEMPVVTKILPPSSDMESNSLLTELLFAEAYANFVSVRTYIPWICNPPMIEHMNIFQETHADFFVGSRPGSRVALLLSNTQIQAIRREADCLYLSRKLQDMKLEHAIIPDRMLTPENLAQFDVVILPHTEMLTEKQLRTLEAYKRKGVLIVLGPCGTQDEWMRPRKDGLQRLVGDLAQRAESEKPIASKDGHVVYLSDGVAIRRGDAAFRHYYYRQNDGDDLAALKDTIAKSAFGKAWPYLADHSDNVEVHLAAIPERNRIVAHIVNYDLRNPDATPHGDRQVVATDPTGKLHYALTPSNPFELAVRIPADWRGVQVTCATPDGEEDKTLDARIEQRYGAPYAVVQTPTVKIYAVIAFDRTE